MSSWSEAKTQLYAIYTIGGNPAVTVNCGPEVTEPLAPVDGKRTALYVAPPGNQCNNLGTCLASDGHAKSALSGYTTQSYLYTTPSECRGTLV